MKSRRVQRRSRRTMKSRRSRRVMKSRRSHRMFGGGKDIRVVFNVNGHNDATLESMSGKELEAIEIALGSFGLEKDDYENNGTDMYITSLHSYPFYVMNHTPEFRKEYVGEGKGPFPLNYEKYYNGAIPRRDLSKISVSFELE